MQELFFGPVVTWFTVPALIGTAFFLLRTLSMFVGGDATVDADFDVDVDDSSTSFKILSLQAISSFLMGFGWGGLGAYRGGGWPVATSVAFAAVCGAAMVWVLAKMLTAVYRLQSSGNVPMYHALEAEGTVYAGIPAAGAGTGRVRVVIDDREIYYRAVSDGGELARNENVRVVAVNDDNSVTVTKA
jgi:membrane protein implicated in regulation of membrane protease activity